MSRVRIESMDLIFRYRVHKLKNCRFRKSAFRRILSIENLTLRHFSKLSLKKYFECRYNVIKRFSQVVLSIKMTYKKSIFYCTPDSPLNLLLVYSGIPQCHYHITESKVTYYYALLTMFASSDNSILPFSTFKKLFSGIPLIFKC